MRSSGWYWSRRKAPSRVLLKWACEELSEPPLVPFAAPACACWSLGSLGGSRLLSRAANSAASSAEAADLASCSWLLGPAEGGPGAGCSAALAAETRRPAQSCEGGGRERLACRFLRSCWLSRAQTACCYLRGASSRAPTCSLGPLAVCPSVNPLACWPTRDTLAASASASAPSGWPLSLKLASALTLSACCARAARRAAHVCRPAARSL